MPSIIDVAQNVTPNIVHLKADGILTVMRYLTTNTASGKLVLPAEAHVLGANGIRLGLVFEAGGGAPGQSPLTTAQGQIDGTFAARYAPSVGAAEDACIYFAADNDFSPVVIDSNILPYFAAVYKAVGRQFRVGVYGSGAVCQAIINEVSADLAWLSGSMGWTGSRAYLAARPEALRLVQTQEDVKYADMDVDFDEALGDFGDFLPFSPPVLTAAIEPATLPNPTLLQKLMGYVS
jgi:hypothetical protein